MLWFLFIFVNQKSNLLLYSLYCAEACNEFAEPISASLRWLLFKKYVAAAAGRWQRRIRFDRSEIWTADLPLQRQTRYRSTNLWVPNNCNISLFLLILIIMFTCMTRAAISEFPLVRSTFAIFRIRSPIRSNPLAWATFPGRISST